mmetsp:Transcript_115415/g.257896  ORF Transcript_115415/g.257896 Transcript_115415/m.257896 type:complete len:207 (+) Transcript_115415:70-690(+)
MGMVVEQPLLWGGAMLPPLTSLQPRLRQTYHDRFYAPACRSRGDSGPPTWGRQHAAIGPTQSASCRSLGREGGRSGDGQRSERIQLTGGLQRSTSQGLIRRPRSEPRLSDDDGESEYSARSRSVASSSQCRSGQRPATELLYGRPSFAAMPAPDFSVIAIPGYAGHIPSKNAENVMGGVFAKDNLLATRISQHHRSLQRSLEPGYF